VALIIESFAFGRDPLDASMSPLLMLAANLSLAAVGPLAIVATALIGRVPWRRLLASPRRMSLRRWGVYFGAFSLLVIIGLAVMQLIDPGSTGLTSFAVTSTTGRLQRRGQQRHDQQADGGGADVPRGGDA